MALVLASAGPAYAQEASEAEALPSVPVDPPAETVEEPAATEPSGPSIGEIVVTAQKRAENIQDVPITIQAFSGADLDAKGLNDLAKLQASTPGLVVNSVATFAVIYVRGVGTDAFIPSADMSIANYVDGVYLPFSINMGRSFGSVERIEILKGPQGTLFGRNATGGAINTVTKEPSEEFTSTAQAYTGSNEERRARIYVSGPIGFGFSGSLGALYAHRNDYYELTDESPLRNLQPYDDKGLNVRLKWQPSDWFDATLIAYDVKYRGLATSLFQQIHPSLLGQALGLTTEDDYKTSIDANSRGGTETQVGSAILQGRFDALDVKSITSRQRLRGVELADFDGTSKDVAVFRSRYAADGSYGDGGKGLVADVVTSELQFISNDTSWGADRFKWIAGLYYLDSTAGFDPVELSLGGLGDLSTAVGNLPGPVDLPVLALVRSISPVGLPPLGLTFRIKGLLDTRSYAAFTEGTLGVLDWLDVTAGLRYQNEKRKVFDSRVSAVVTYEGSDLLAQRALSYPDDRLKKSDISPKGVLSAHVTDDTMVFLSWQKAFKSGSFNILALTEPPSELRPEKVQTWELGEKADLFGNRLRLNTSVFYTRIDDLQSQFISLTSGGVVAFQNADKSTIKGAEVSAQWAAAQGLTVMFNATYLDGKYDRFEQALGYSDIGLLTNNNDFSGNTIVRNPKWTGALGFDWNQPAPGGTVGVGMDVYYNSGYWFDAQNTLKQPGYTQVSARTNYWYEPWDLRVSVGVNNLTDAERYMYQFQYDFGVFGKLDEPRTWFVQLDWNFGS